MTTTWMHSTFYADHLDNARFISYPIVLIHKSGSRISSRPKRANDLLIVFPEELRTDMRIAQKQCAEFLSLTHSIEQMLAFNVPMTHFGFATAATTLHCCKIQAFRILCPLPYVATTKPLPHVCQNRPDSPRSILHYTSRLFTKVANDGLLLVSA